MQPDPTMLPRVFISYRRSDTGIATASFAELLRHHLSDEVVFLDHDGLQWAAPWRDQLDVAIADRDVLLCLIGPDWEGRSGDDGRRIDEPDDPVRREIVHAVASGVEVMPIRVDRTDMPTDLPTDIAPAVSQPHSATLRSTDFDADFAVILAGLWEARLRHVSGAHVVVTVGRRDVRADEFLDVIRRQYPEEVRFLSLAATQRMSLSMVDTRTNAPNLFSMYLADDVDERDRRLVAAFLAGPWGKVTIAVGGAAAGYTVAQLANDPARAWLAELVDGADAVVEVIASTGGSATSATTAASSASQPVAAESGSSGLRGAITARPRIALVAALVGIGGAAVGAVALSGGDGGDGGNDDSVGRAVGNAGGEGTTVISASAPDDALANIVQTTGLEDRSIPGHPSFRVDLGASDACGGGGLDFASPDPACSYDIVDGPGFLRGKTLTLDDINGVPFYEWAGQADIDQFLDFVGVDESPCPTDSSWYFRVFRGEVSIGYPDGQMLLHLIDRETDGPCVAFVGSSGPTN